MINDDVLAELQRITAEIRRQSGERGIAHLLTVMRRNMPELWIRAHGSADAWPFPFDPVESLDFEDPPESA